MGIPVDLHFFITISLKKLYRLSSRAEGGSARPKSIRQCLVFSWTLTQRCCFSRGKRGMEGGIWGRPRFAAKYCDFSWSIRTRFGGLFYFEGNCLADNWLFHQLHHFFRALLFFCNFLEAYWASLKAIFLDSIKFLLSLVRLILICWTTLTTYLRWSKLIS